VAALHHTSPCPFAAFTALKPTYERLSEEISMKVSKMLIDAHSHVDRYDLVDEQALGSALSEITQHGILTISNSMDLPSYKRNLEISEMCRLVLPTFGVHSWNAPDYADRLDDLSEAIERSPMLGESGRPLRPRWAEVDSEGRQQIAPDND
jgi:hypothetical protein